MQYILFVILSFLIGTILFYLSNNKCEPFTIGNDIQISQNLNLIESDDCECYNLSSSGCNDRDDCFLIDFSHPYSPNTYECIALDGSDCWRQTAEKCEILIKQTNKNPSVCKVTGLSYPDYQCIK